MIRKIVKIDEEKCNGCGICVEACHEGALKIVDGKAKLISESYCDGLGDCLPGCPEGAIVIEERDAQEYDEEAVKRNMEEKNNLRLESLPCGCPGTHSRKIEKNWDNIPVSDTVKANSGKSQLAQWPCQIKLVPVNAPYFDNAHILVAADCTAFAYANIHNDFMRKKVTLIGCPKLDSVDYGDKLTQILLNHEIKSITVLRMEVPCCGGIVNAVKKALENCGKLIPWSVVTISAEGNILED